MGVGQRSLRVLKERQVERDLKDAFLVGREEGTGLQQGGTGRVESPLGKSVKS